MYIGVFEWLAFAAIAKQRVVMLFGSAPVDITAVYGCVVPDLQALEYHPLSFAVIACNADGAEAHYTTAVAVPHESLHVGRSLRGRCGVRARPT